MSDGFGQRQERNTAAELPAAVTGPNTGASYDKSFYDREVVVGIADGGQHRQAQASAPARHDARHPTNGQFIPTEAQ